jgi:putative (di)nucleoside polyphosphate hydrolase
MPRTTVFEPPPLPLRPCVGIALFNAKGRVWIGRRLPKWLGDKSRHIWQMPQGGIDRGEAPEEAALRELFEETHVSSVEIVDEIEGWLTYELPDELLGVALKGRYRGQKQRWFAMRFKGRNSEIDIRAPRGQKAEFDNWRWADLKELPKLIVPFKRELYETVIDEFSHLARET